MKSTHIRICLLSFVGVMAFVGMVLSQPGSQIPKPIHKHGEPELPPVRPLRALGSLGNMINMTNREDPHQQAVARLLETHACPDSRLNYFKPIMEREGLRLLGWHHEIVNVESVGGIDQTTVQVQPIVTAKNGRPVRLTGATVEVFVVQKDSLVPLRNETLGSPTGIVME
ncbi:MAG TPA: hypothetical protein VFQ26_09610 [Nitrospiraceae bacterium]|nr:hypothetical protein [Nitrospiraceae bacterium]